MVVLEDFGLHYAGAQAPALRGINLRVKPGEFLLVTGPTGSGKTTLLRTLAGLMGKDRIAAMSGNASINGVDIQDAPAIKKQVRVGIVFQNPDDQITGLTPREEIGFGLENLGLIREDVSLRTLAALKFCGLEQRADEKIHTLSGGQKQRVTLAAVTAMEPDLLLLDEPISNLDVSSRKYLVELLAKMKGKGKTILVCTHEVEDFLPLCDRLAIMKEGRIVDVGNPGTMGTDNGLISSIGLEKLHPFDTRHFGSGNSGNGAYPIISLRKAFTGYGKGRFELGPLDMDIRAGEIVAVLGDNGCGKTTLLSLVAGLLKLRSGEVVFEGKKTNRFRCKAMVRETAFVAQNPDLMLHCATVEREMVSRPRYLKLKNSQPEVMSGNGLKEYGLVSFAERHPFSLSQGQRQRLALGAAVSGGMKLLVVDEPTTGQDWLQINEIFRHFRRLADDGTAVVFSTHNVRAVSLYADRGVLLAEGKIVLDVDLRNPEKRSELFSALQDEHDIDSITETDGELSFMAMDDVR